MNAIFKLMMFSIMLNFSVGIMLQAVPAFGDDPSTTSGLTYNATLSDGFTDNMANTVTPSGNLQDEGNAIYRVLDMLNLGFITDFLNAIKTYVYGFPILLDKMFGATLQPGVRTIVFSTMNVLITIGYMLGAFALWTGRDISKG